MKLVTMLMPVMVTVVIAISFRTSSLELRDPDITSNLPQKYLAQPVLLSSLRAFTLFAESNSNKALMSEEAFNVRGSPALAPVSKGREALEQDIPFEELPSFGMCSARYRVDSYIKIASSLQALGKANAIEILRKAAKNPSSSKLCGSAFSVLARMLFSAKRGQRFREMALCQGWQFYGGTSRDDWPLLPIDIVDNVPFLIADWVGVICINNEKTADYLEYCISNCEWSTVEFKPLTAEQKKKALDRLLASMKWKIALNEGEKKNLELQIK